jgi:hypothetical protein
VDQETLRIALEQWDIWKTWEIAFYRHEVSKDTHPGYRGKDPKYDELESALKARLTDSPEVASHRLRAAGGDTSVHVPEFEHRAFAAS